MPDYDGLPEPGDDVGDALRWTARILTGPLYLASEYLLRRPVGWLAIRIEEHHLIYRLLSFLTFGPDDNIVILPVFFYDFGFQPSVGLYARWNQFLFDENRISVLAAFGGVDWLTWQISDQITLDQWQIGVRLWLRRRPDFVFGGIGPDATVLPFARFSADEVATLAWVRFRYWRNSDIELRGIYRNLAFDDQGWDGDPSVGQRAAAFEEPLPYGFATGYDAAGGELRVALDTSRPGGPPEGGVRLAGYVGEFAGFGGLPEFDYWLRWGASVTAGADLDRARVLGVTLQSQFVTPHGDSRVPFGELIDVGGAGPLSGFFPGQIRGFSAAALTVHYTWPIWVFLDAQLFFATGNAFGEHLEDFDLDLLRLSFGLALRPRLPGQNPFDMRLAFGTETYARGFDIVTVRFVIGNWNTL